MNGFLLIDKPTGLSSFQVLRKIDHHFHISRNGQKIGHGGTLDPEASGLLVAAIGRATRLLKYFLGSDKHYLADICLGRSTTTDDATGETRQEGPWQHLSRHDVENALTQFRGTIQQIPPDFSALHVQGKRAYHLAAEGKPVHLEPRSVTIYTLRSSCITRHFPLHCLLRRDLYSFDCTRLGPSAWHLRPFVCP